MKSQAFFIGTMNLNLQRCRSQIFSSLWNNWFFRVDLPSLHLWSRQCWNWFWAYFWDLKRIMISRWKTSHCANNWQQWGDLSNGPDFAIGIVSSGFCFPVFGPVGKMHWSLSNPKLSFGGTERASNCFGDLSSDTKASGTFRSAPRSVILFAEWQRPIRFGVRPEFMESCESSVLRFPNERFQTWCLVGSHHPRHGGLFWKTTWQTRFQSIFSWFQLPHFGFCSCW